MNRPKVSVVMSVYNGEAYLREAVKSILNQTFSDFEFIIINDGSTDRTPEILETIKDPRVRVINQPNRGLTVSLNRGIRLAQGEYIARMDADDISEPERLERQVEIIDRNPNIALVGCWYKVVDEQGKVLAHRKLPIDSDKLAKELVHRNILCHGSVLIRKDAVEAVGLYNESLRYAQDYELWLRMLREGFKASVVPDFLYSYRISPESVAKVYAQQEYVALIKRMREGKTKAAGSRTMPNLVALSQKQKRSLYHYAVGTLKLENGEVKEARRELLKSLRIDPLNIRPWYRMGLSFLPAWVRGLVSGSAKRVRDSLAGLKCRWSKLMI